MRRILLASTAIVAVSVSVAHAQVVVIDPKAIVQDTLTAEQTLETLKGIVHGNTFGIGSLVPGLNTGMAVNPLSGANPTAMMSGSSGGSLASLMGQYNTVTTPFTPTGGDSEAQLLLQRASAAAGQLAVAAQAVSGTQSRLTSLPSLGDALSTTADEKAATDANTRVAYEGDVQGAQQQQLQALAIYQQAEANAERSRTELVARQGAECAAAQAQAEAQTAASGTLSIVNTSTNCADGDAGTGNVVSSGSVNTSGGTTGSTTLALNTNTPVISSGTDTGMIGTPPAPTSGDSWC